MKTSSILTFSSLVLGFSLSLIPGSVSAQSTGFGNSGDNRDPFNRASTGDTAGLMQLINQAQLGSLRNNPEYVKEQQEQINSATEDFRARQLQVLRQQAKQKSQSTTVPTVK